MKILFIYIWRKWIFRERTSVERVCKISTHRDGERDVREEKMVMGKISDEGEGRIVTPHGLFVCWLRHFTSNTCSARGRYLLK